MNNSKNAQGNLGQTQLSNVPARNSTGALDQSFIPAWLMGGAVILVVLLTALSGWKIVNLEAERSNVESQRRLLERDKQAYAEIQRELPSLEKREQDLLGAVGELEGKERGARTRYESLTAQGNAAQLEMEKAKAERDQAQAAAQAARKQFASMQADIQKARADSQSSKQEVEALQAQEQTLRKRMTELTGKVAQLQADMSGLDRERQNKERVLQQMAQDTGDLQKLSKRFDTIADNLDPIQA